MRDFYDGRSSPRRDFYLEAILDTARWRPEDAPTTRESLEAELEDDGTAAGIREDAIRLGQTPDDCVTDYVDGMLYAIEHQLTEEEAVEACREMGQHRRKS